MSDDLVRLCFLSLLWLGVAFLPGGRVIFDLTDMPVMVELPGSGCFNDELSSPPESEPPRPQPAPRPWFLTPGPPPVPVFSPATPGVRPPEPEFPLRR